jgi:prepilin-type N-terminal cleavage/methylation domain-containing protein
MKRHSTAPPREILRRFALSGGFTLIELSIVLVIIALIVGGVLVGKDLISAAYVRAQITQIERFNTAVNTFYGKYGYICPATFRTPRR